jgi:hypothetical protein
MLVELQWFDEGDLKAYRRDPARGRDGSDRATGVPQSVSEHFDIPLESCVELFWKTWMQLRVVERRGMLEGELEVVKRSSN